MPDPAAPTFGGRRGGAGFVYQPQPSDPPELAEEMRLIVNETYRTVRPVVIVGMTLVFTAAVCVSWIWRRC